MIRNALGLWALVACVLIASHGATAPLAQQTVVRNSDPIAQALKDPRRPAASRERDIVRHPAEVLSFTGLKQGDRVADFMPGNGYFTRLFSDIVGPNGHVYAVISSEMDRVSADETAGVKEMATDKSYANLTVLTEPVTQFSTPEPLDLVWTSRNYHDLHDSFMDHADMAAINRAVFKALRPGGIFLVIDHVAEAGSGLRDTETLHRIDPEAIKREVIAAGFVFDGESNVLRNPSDDHKLPVFDKKLRDRTDQVVFKFRKP
jgi:predicted methyltransferase